MSKYCGKCDLWDSLANIHKVTNKDADWSKIKIYQLTDESHFTKDGWQNVKLLDIKSIKDLLPYAPFISSVSTYSDGVYTTYISDKSYIDVMEEERLEWVARDAKRICLKCKRQDREFIAEDVANEIAYFREDVGTYILEVVNRVKARPYSFKLDGIRAPICEMYRKYLYKDMVDMGYTEHEAHEWCWNGNKTW